MAVKTYLMADLFPGSVFGLWFPDLPEGFPGLLLLLVLLVLEPGQVLAGLGPLQGLGRRRRVLVIAEDGEGGTSLQNTGLV